MSVLLIVGLVAAGCAARGIPPDPGPAGQPRASWTLRTGDLGGQGRIVCRSDQPQPCVIAAGSESAPRSVAVSVYLYAAGASTTYRGFFFAGFIGDTGYDSMVTYQIEPEAQPTALAISGRVVSAPGSYEFLMALSADLPGQPDARMFEFAVPVTVRDPAAAD